MVLTTATMAGHQQMTAREKDIYDTYSEDLDGLTWNSKPIINSMTELAIEYSSDFAHVIVRCIEDKIKMVSSSQKLPLLYLLDSILKNHKDNRQYNDLFQQNIVSIFAHVFHNVPQEQVGKVRTALYKLRGSWTDWRSFSLTKLNQLDRKIHTLDPQWPIRAMAVDENHTPPSQSIHINPAVFGRQQSLTPENDLDAQMKKKELELIELRMKREELALENMRQQMSANRDAQDRAKSPGQNSSGISTSVISKAGSNRIIIDEKKLKDPRMRSKILEAINKAEGITSSSIGSDDTSKSVTSDRNSRLSERLSRSKSKSPSNLRNVTGQATSTTGSSNIESSRQGKTSRTPSPLRARQSPTSTSSPRYADTNHSSHEKKSTTPPPPPRISDVIKVGKSENKASNKAPKREKNDFDSKSKSTSSSISSTKATKRRNEENIQGKEDSKKMIVSKSSKLSTNAKYHKEGMSNTLRRSRDDTDNESSSSPSPPPEKDKKVKSTFKDKEETSSGINFRLKGRQKVKEKNPFRIPKKEKADTAKQVNTRTPSPQSFTSEGPLVEFNEGRSPLKDRKRHGSKSGNNSQSRLKKSKLNNELFGDGKSIGKLISPAEGWAGVKKENPDLFRTQVNENRAGHDPIWKSGFRNNRAIHSQNQKVFPDLFQSRPGAIMNQQGGNVPQFEKLLQDMKNFDPDFVLTQVIPNIVQQGQSLIATNKIGVEQFSKMMKGVFQLKEHALMQQAEKRHVTQLMNNFLEDSQPVKNPLIAQVSTSSPNANDVSICYNKNADKKLIKSKTPMNIGVCKLPSKPLTTSRIPLSHKANENLAVAPMKSQIIKAEHHFTNRDLPIANETEISNALNDPVKKIEIDDFPRDIRYYGETALIIMGPEAKDMLEIKFKIVKGAPSLRRLIIDQKYIVSVNIDSSLHTLLKLDSGQNHTVKIGAPTRELWVDGHWNELYFNKKGTIRIGSTFHEAFLEGPPPNVDIGSVPRNDLCVGTVQLIIDGDINTIVTIYLDSKPQLVIIAGKQHILKFVQGLKMLLINGHPFRTEFGGMPMVVYVNQIKHYLRLTALPGGVKLNNIKLWNMDENQQNANATSMSGSKPNSPKNSSQDGAGHNETTETTSQNPPSPELFNENSQEAFSVTAQNNAAFDRLLNMIPTTPINLGGGLKMPNETKSETSIGQEEAQNCSYTSTPVNDKVRPVWTDTNKEQSSNTDAENQSSTSVEKSVDVHNLWAQLLGAGLVSNPSTTKAFAIPGLDTPSSESKGTEKQGLLAEKENFEAEKSSSKSPKKKEKIDNSPNKDVVNKKDNKLHPYKEIVLKSHHSSIKTRQTAIIDMVYDPSALQCKNCGLRFSTSQSDSEAYSKHLDWHFRVKRREKDNAKKAESRRWYFEKVDWIISDEIEEDKEGNEDPKSRSGTPAEIPIVPAGSSPEDNICPICHEEFDQFYKQDFADISSSEGVGGKGRTFSDDDGGGCWHLKNAIRPEVSEKDSNDPSTEKYAGRAFHPQCYQDRNNTTLNDTSTSIEQAKSEVVSTTDLFTDASECQSAMEESEASSLSKEIPNDSESCQEEPLNPKTSDSGTFVKVEPIEAAVNVESNLDVEMEDNDENVDINEESNKPLDMEIKEEPTKVESTNSLASEGAEEADKDLSNEIKSTKIETEELLAEEQTKIEASSEADAVKEAVSDDQKDMEDKNDSINLVNKSLDGNTLMAAPIIPAIGSNLSGGIKINIRPNDAAKEESGKREISRSVSESDDGENEKGAEFDQDSIIQPAKPEHEELKPKLKGRKLVDMPMQRKGGELSSLCAIM